MIQQVRITIDGEEYLLEPGNYTITEMIGLTRLHPEVKQLRQINTDDDVVVGPGSFEIKGQEEFEALQPEKKPAEAEVTTLEAPEGKSQDPIVEPPAPVVILPAPIAPAAPLPIPFLISTSKLPNAKVGQTYHAALMVEGGKMPLTAKLAEGSLPDGLGLREDSGLILGVPTVAGASSFSIKVVSADGQETPAKLFSIEVIP